MSACENPPCTEVGPFRYCPIKGCGWMEEQPAPTGAELIATERQRQVDAEGWTPEHDSEHVSGELAQAAVAYIQATDDYQGDTAEDIWPWDRPSWKPSEDPIRNLVKAGALIAAEIDRLQRKAPHG